ncbi:UPF0223 family protein [Hutsoniella sourekii]|uniref:UPF0223 family protein n=1 Tax=Hutsoniella sourekii TaxID=87650 RepID=UPI000488D548|nr:UPF0223 family protein [Hutsoniella sourekii]
MANFSYPIQDDWTTEETAKVVTFLATVERVYHEGVPQERFAKDYQAYQTVIDSIAAQKRLERQFDYSIYQAVKYWRENKDHLKTIKL